MECSVLIGAGSAVFTRGLLADLIAHGHAGEVRLVDPNPEALATAHGLAKKMIAQTGAPLTLKASTNRRDLLPGATVVICTVGVGGRRAWEQDVFIPRAHGIYVPVGDTVGPGGSSRAVRMIPAMIAIARDVVDLAPAALFFNYSNPMAPICQAIRQETGANVIGLCHGVLHVMHYLAAQLNIPADEMSVSHAGYNHLTWLTALSHRGVDLFPAMHALGARIIAQSPTHPDDNRFSWEIFNQVGAFPAVLDRHVTEFFPQFFRTGAYYGMMLGVDAFSFEGTIAGGDQEYTDMQQDALSTEPLPTHMFVRESGEHEQVVEIVSALRHGSGAEYAVNVPNHGVVPDLPAHAIVEIPARMEYNSVVSVQQPALGPACSGMLASRYAWVDAIVYAAVHQDRDAFIHALVIDGYVDSLPQAVALGDELWRHTTRYRAV
jgi:alpha-galactosidase